jgi:hypothetical protein
MVWVHERTIPTLPNVQNQWAAYKHRLDVRAVVAGFPLRRPWFEPMTGHVGFVLDKSILKQVLSEYFGFPSAKFSASLTRPVVIFTPLVGKKRRADCQMLRKWPVLSEIHF